MPPVHFFAGLGRFGGELGICLSLALLVGLGLHHTSGHNIQLLFQTTAAAGISNVIVVSLVLYSFSEICINLIAKYSIKLRLYFHHLIFLLIAIPQTK